MRCLAKSMGTQTGPEMEGRRHRDNASTCGVGWNAALNWSSRGTPSGDALVPFPTFH